MEEDWMTLLAGRRRVELGGGMSLRLLTAMEVLEARREAEVMSREDRERALCSNACLLARALEQGGKPLFLCGEAVLGQLSVDEIGALARRWAMFRREEDPSPEDGEERVETLKKALSTRHTPDFSGVCSRLFARFPRRGGQRK